MIDSHIHIAPPGLPGVGSLNPILEWPTEARAAALRQEMESAGMDHVLAMGAWNAPPEDPTGIAAILSLARDVPGVHAVGVADPTRTEPEHFRQIELLLAAGQIRAFKGYLGYLHFGPDHPHYRPYYELAERFNIPFIFHTGDTYSPRAKLRFAHPLLVDEVAVDHPRVRFVMAHLGNPWMAEAAEVIYKNINVWADLSGLMVGDAEVFHGEERKELLQDAVTAVGRAFRYAERPTRFVYGSDWPLAPMVHYRDFIRSAIPELYHPLVFEENAHNLFRL